MLCEMLNPLIQETIRNSIDASMLGLRETTTYNMKLQNSINKQNVTIEQQENITMKQGRKLRVKKDILTELEADTRIPSAELDDLKVGLGYLK